MIPSREQRAARHPAASTVRTAVLVATSLAAVGGAYLLYHRTAEPLDLPETTSPEIPAIHQPFLEGDRAARQDRDSGLEIEGLKVTAQDTLSITILYEGSLHKKIHMNYEDATQVDDSGRQFHLKHPLITYYMKKGQKAVIRADEAIMTSREKGKIDPQRGVFRGQVRIDMDRTTDHWRREHPDLAQRPTPRPELVRVWMDEVEFDLELGHLKVPGSVRVEAREMLLDGRGLVVRWSESNGRIEELTLEQGHQLLFAGGFGLGVDVGDWSAGWKQQDSAAPPSFQEETAPANSANAVVDREQPATTGSDHDSVLIVDLPRKTQTQKPALVSYVVDFASRVVARQRFGGGGLLADRLEVLFDLPANFSSSSERQSPASDGGSQPQSDHERFEERAIAVTWDGPLRIHCLGEVGDEPQELRRHLTAVGQPVVLENRDGQARCGTFVRHLETGYTKFIGQDGVPVRIQGQDLDLEATESVILDLNRRHANLEGQVSMTFDGSLLRGETIDASFRKPQAGGGRSLRDLLDVLQCDRNVSLRTTQDLLTCQRLTVRMASDPQGRNLPQRATATRQVALSQGRRRLKTPGTLEVQFGELPTDAQGNPAADSPVIKALKTEGAVSIVDPPRGWDISGHHLRCDFDHEQVLTYGYIEGTPDRPADVRLGPYRVVGRTVEFDETREWAHVPGAGSVEFILTEDLDGRRSNRPIPVTVEWDRHMTLMGAENQLAFAGNTVARSTNNTLKSEGLQVMLEDVPQQPAAEPEGVRPLNMWFLKPFEPEIRDWRWLAAQRPQRSIAKERIRKRATYILADNEVLFESRTVNRDSARLESLVTLEGPKMAFDLLRRLLSVEGAGRLGIQDYPLDEGMAGGGSRSTGLLLDVGSSGPSQTLIAWDSSMHYHYAQRVAEFNSSDAPLQFIHHSGQYILQPPKAAGLTNQKLDQMRRRGSGRKTALNCMKLLVEFRPASGPAGPGAGQMSLGQLRQFQATRRVLLDDTRWYVTGDRMDYVADTELISVYGRPGQDAYINGLDRKAGRAVEARCPELHVELRTGRLNAPCKIQTSSG